VSLSHSKLLLRILTSAVQNSEQDRRAQMAKKLTTTVLVSAVLTAMSGSGSANVVQGVEQRAKQAGQNYQPLVQWFALHPSEFKLFLKSLGSLRGEINDCVILAQARDVGAPKVLVTPRINTPTVTPRTNTPTVTPRTNTPTVTIQKQNSVSPSRPRCW